MGSIFLTSGYSRGERTCLDTGLFSIINTLDAIRSDRPCRKTAHSKRRMMKLKNGRNAICSAEDAGIFGG
jgi:hypothetical protein